MNKSELAKSVKSSLDQYFKDLDGEPPHALYDMVLACIEKPLLEYTMQYVNGNQSKAAEVLGLNRNTLRKKLQIYKID
ncbi:MAG: helix-turn-helix domain-containing protein [Methylotenera sp.]|jgi:Fis family transcriptional regulator, factor for inversion stimulation protein|nr:MAG: Fis family transcriptional regulator [Methylotenera sp.]HNU65888.1 helix-turn-helix domain-containing protein [Methylotenera sp.]HOY87597.1 helix-turn-helix domain-containing protein [Methylotenera sp.]HPH07374.1 helix-turn-helix domain-containing protein [Methylotenera sp.]HPM48921.1 helix-turn-helix domain-containing protein [Methylotenera sp.]